MARQRPAVGVACLLALQSAIALAPATPAAAQAWVPPQGAGSITVSTQVIDNTGHRLTDGFLLDDGKSTTVAVYVEGEYAATDRLSFAIGLPYVFARYRGPGPSLADLPVDQCRCWHRGWQDVGAAVRYNLVNGPVALTPSVAFGVPSRGYDYEGEAVVGFGLKEARLALDGGVRLDPISPRLSVQARYAYSFVEKAAGVSHDRSNITLRGAYLVTGRLSAGATVAWQRTHGGLRIGPKAPEGAPPPPLIPGTAFPMLGEVNTAERFRQHDRLLRDNNWRLGANAAYSFERFDVFASYLHFMGGTETHAGRAFTLGISWPFGS